MGEGRVGCLYSWEMVPCNCGYKGILYAQHTRVWDQGHKGVSLCIVYRVCSKLQISETHGYAGSTVCSTLPPLEPGNIAG